MTTRREVLTLGAAAIAMPGVGRLLAAVPRASRPLDILVLGGTGFFAPHQVEYALARGPTAGARCRRGSVIGRYQKLGSPRWNGGVRRHQSAVQLRRSTGRQLSRKRPCSSICRGRDRLRTHSKDRRLLNRTGEPRDYAGT
jgi:hypothetical protein